MRLLWSLCVMLSALAHASGFGFSENGTKALLQGGAFVAQADDLSALLHNPAGLALQPGFTFLADGQLVFLNVSFQRQDPGFDPANPSRLSNAVSSKPIANVLPLLAVGYGIPLGSRTLGIAAGVYGPPAAARTAFPMPNYERDAMGSYLEDPRRNAGHRYMMIEQDLLIAYPTLSVALDVHPKVLVGLSAQLVVSRFQFKSAISSALTTPTRLTAEDPADDSLVGIDVAGKVGVTGVVGVLVRPIEQLQFGASFRPPFQIEAFGDFVVQLGQKATQLGAQVTGDKATLRFNMPAELKVGARFQPIKRLGFNLDFLWQGWSALDAQVLTPDNVTLTLLGSTAPVPTFRNEKKWQNALAIRAGGSFDIIEQLTVMAGAWYETQAAPDAYFNVDFAHFSRLHVSGGVAVHLGPVDVMLGVMGTPPQTRAITVSELRVNTSDSAVPGNFSNAGLYTVGGWSASVGVRGHFRPAPK